MKKGIKLILAAVALCVLVGAWLLVRRIPDSDQEPAATTELIYVVKTDPALLSTMEYSFGGETYRFAYTNGKWVNPADLHMPLDQTELGYTASALTTVACNRFVSDSGADGEEYGLDEPGYRIVLTYTDGSSVSYKIGDKNIHTSDYYFAVEGNSSVYMVNAALLGYCDRTYDELLSLDKIREIDAEAVTKIISETPTGTITFTPGERTVTETDEEGNETSSQEVYYTLKNEAENESELDETSGSAVLKGILSTVIVSCADYYAESAELAAYGLDAATTVTIYYTVEQAASSESATTGTVKTEVSYTLSFGFIEEADGTRTAYLRLPESDMVFRVDISACSALF